MKVFKKEVNSKGKKFTCFSGITKSGVNVSVRFSEELLKLLPKDKDGEVLKAFLITNIKGQKKIQEIVIEEGSRAGEVFENVIYYVKECEFSEIPNEDLED